MYISNGFYTINVCNLTNDVRQSYIAEQGGFFQFVCIYKSMIQCRPLKYFIYSISFLYQVGYRIKRHRGRKVFIQNKKYLRQDLVRIGILRK